MMVQQCKMLNFDFVVLDPESHCPANQVGAEQIIGSYKNKEDIEKISKCVDVMTYDIEHINTEKLKELNIPVRPSPQILDVIKDKLLQKELLKKNNIPTSNFVNSIEEGIINFNYPFVQKLRKGGYDGKGVIIIKNEKDLKEAFKEDYFIEEMVNINKELAVIVAQDINGNMEVYPVVEMVFDERTNMCNTVVAPAQINNDLMEKAKEIGLKTIKALGNGAVGIFAIEMFLTNDNEILVNEIAPRPHNSAHFTLDGCITSQFEQHIRAIAGFPLGSPELIMPTVMVNIIGEGNGNSKVLGLKEVLKIEGVKVHLYGKKYVKPARKMGHVNIIDKDINSAINKAEIVKKTLKVIGCQK